MYKQKLVIASGNEGKLNDIANIVQCLPNLEHNIKLIKLSEYGDITAPDEPYDNFLDNAKHKAKYYAQITKEATFAEDAGLLIKKLNGFPGVRTKEFALECGGYSEVFKKLEEMLSDYNDKSATFHCSAVIYFPKTEKFITYSGEVSGYLSFPARGEHGFAFDKIFVPTGYNETFAELGEKIKSKISHRAAAVNGVLDKLYQYINRE